MPGPPPAVAACRVAVRRWLREADLPAGSGVLVACSGGADSLALAAATGFVAPREGLRVDVVVVDHGLQQGSQEVARTAAATVRGALREGAGPRRGGPGEAGGARVEVVRAGVEETGAGPEADARRARYAALGDAAGRLGAAAVLVGHTLDDQAEQVLLGLARGSGARSLAGMPSRRDLAGAGPRPGPAPLLGRPLLGVSRAQTRAACAELGLVPWEDPHNADPRFARVRARRALVELEANLGPGLVANLARTAELLRDDVHALDEASEAAYRQLGDPPWPVHRLAGLPRALRTRLWRRLALAAGSPGTDLTREHLLAVDGLVTRWRGQGPLPLPGGVRAQRQGDRVWLAPGT